MVKKGDLLYDFDPLFDLSILEVHIVFHNAKSPFNRISGTES